MPDFANITLTDMHEVLSQATLKIGNITINPLTILKSILVILVLMWVVGFLVKRLDKRLRRISSMRASNRALTLKLVQVALYCVVFLIGMQMMGINLTALSVFGGALGVGLGFGLQKIASNFVSGIILLSEKSIEVNDIIELADGTVGTIKRTGGRFTLLDTQDGREVMIPNEEFINQRAISWTHSDKHARVEIAVTVAYDSNIELAKKIMVAAANAHSKRTTSRPSWASLHAFRDSGVEIHLYFWIADIADGRMEPKSDVMLMILNDFRANGICIPYPQRELRITNAVTSEAAAGGGI
jgi:small-conductance mechanosensitive channel